MTVDVSFISPLETDDATASFSMEVQRWGAPSCVESTTLRVDPILGRRSSNRGTLNSMGPQRGHDIPGMKARRATVGLLLSGLPNGRLTSHLLHLLVAGTVLF